MKEAGSSDDNKKEFFETASHVSVEEYDGHEDVTIEHNKKEFLE